MLHPYLCAGLSLPRLVVRDVARFRLGSHGLQVFKGRISDPPVPFAKRACPCCARVEGVRRRVVGPVDTEHHLLFKCTATEAVRQKYPRLAQMNDLRRLFQSEDVSAVAHFVSECMRVRGV